MLLNNHQIESCIDYIKLKEIMGVKNGTTIKFIKNKKEYVGTINGPVISYTDEHGNYKEIKLNTFINIEYTLKVPYKDLQCRQIDCSNCPLQEINCKVSDRSNTLQEILNQSISAKSIKNYYQKKLEEEN